jgi:hypothetical protein
MTYVLLGVAVIGFLAFLLLQPKVKALIAFFLMMQFFDLAPNMLFGMYVWDYGAMLMLVTAAEVFFRRPAVETPRHGYLVVLNVFLGWLVICFFWSLVVYGYPLMHTVKNARYFVLGYFMTLIFIRLFAVQPESFEFLMKWIYRLTFALMPVLVLQYVLQKPLLSGLVSEFEGGIRAVPIFLPLCLLNFWIITTKILSAGKVAVHERVYLALALCTVALSFTRGIYIAVILTGGLQAWIMARDHTLKASTVVNVAAAAILVVVVLFASGLAQKVGGRALSGLQLLSSSEPASSHERKDDTFNGRLGLAAERFSLAWAMNPVLGYGFLHEDDVPSELRNRLRYGTPLAGTAADPTAYSRFYAVATYYTLGFYTADIGWADIVISTGCVGVLLLVALVLTFIVGHLRDRDAGGTPGYALRTGIFLQVVVLFLLTFDGNVFYYAVHVPAFLFAGYAMIRGRQPIANTSIARPRLARFPNLLR